MMNEEEKLPFFLNTRRLQRADSYFEIGRTQDKLRKLLADKNNPQLVPIPCQNLDENTQVALYGINRFISLEPDPEIDHLFEKGVVGIDEDVQFENTSAFSLFWMTFKRIALSFGENVSSNKVSRDLSTDVESNSAQETQNKELCAIRVDPSFRDPKIKQSKILYGDDNYLIQKFRMDLNCGSLDVALFSVEFPSSSAEGFYSTDLQSYVVSPECGSFVWIENGKASAIFFTQSSEDFMENVMEWFRKILSDMILADSVMIGHPYYWHAPVRRRLTKVMRYLKRLYRNLALKAREGHKLVNSNTTAIAVKCPTEISKLVINEQSSQNLLHTCTTYEQLNIMVEQLVNKWLAYQQNLTQSFAQSLGGISRAWAESSPQSICRRIKDSDTLYESVTFLDFPPDKRESCSDGLETESNMTSCLPEPTPSNNNNISMNNAKSLENKISCIDTGQTTCESCHVSEGCHVPQDGRVGGDEVMCKIILEDCSISLGSEASIETDDSERNVAQGTCPNE